MMKHIVKKLLRNQKVSSEVAETFASVPVDDNEPLTYKTVTDGYYPLLYTTTNDIIQAFFYEHKKKKFCIPEPNPITIYFHTAQGNLTNIYKTRTTLLMELDKQNASTSAIINLCYIFYSVSSVYVIFLFTALEAFMNYQIPEDHKYCKKDSRGVEQVYDQEAIQRYLSFIEKLKEVIPGITGKYFHREAGHKYDHIEKLQILRDQIMHTKVEKINYPNIYKGLFSNLLDFPYDKAILSVRDYINYYSPNLIEECGCGRPE